MGCPLGQGASPCSTDPGKDLRKNFRALVTNLEAAADLYAFSDQDDVWDTDKLRRAGEWLLDGLDDVPRLWCSRTRLVDEQGNFLGLSPWFRREPTFVMLSSRASRAATPLP